MHTHDDEDKECLDERWGMYSSSPSGFSYLHVVLLACLDPLEANAFKLFGARPAFQRRRGFAPAESKHRY